MTFQEWWEKMYSYEGNPAPTGERKDIARMAWDAAIKEGTDLTERLQEAMAKLPNQDYVVYVQFYSSAPNKIYGPFTKKQAKRIAKELRKRKGRDTVADFRVRKFSQG